MGIKFYAASGVILAVMAAAMFVLPTNQDRAGIDFRGFDAQSSSIKIANTGAVVLRGIDVYVDDVKITTVSAPVEPGSTAEIFLPDNLRAGMHVIKVASAGYSNRMTVDVPEQWIANFEIKASK